MYNVIENFRISFNELLSIREIDTVSMARALNIDPSLVRRWRNNGIDVRLKTLIRLSDFFECSIEYLCGKTHEYERFAPNNNYPDFGERLRFIMREAGVRPCRLFDSAKIIPSKYYYWLGGGEPSLTSLDILAAYFNVTLDYLVGRQRSK